MNEKWWTNAVIYAVDVERFFDSNGDGIGDFKGLAQKLPYLSELGVTALWLLPFYDSTEGDNGYDVTDYLHIGAKYGTLDDFLAFLHEAGAMGIRIIMDLVVDHTSNRHPWFEAARYAPESRFRNYYYWTRHPPVPTAGNETLFPGEESSVWTFEPIAGAYYHHRFYHFEPSLNIHNADVRDEIKRILDFWLAFGVSGFRLDAAGRMTEYPGHDDMDPGDVHLPLRDIFRHVKSLDESVMLVGEVDTEPEEVTHFMDGSQMDMCFNFFLNNYLYLALATGKAEPIMRSYRLLHGKLQSSQSVNFLRNLDELDLTQLTDEERQAVYKSFAPEEGMIIYNRGIRRRLAPMLGGDIRRLKMAYSLLFSLPGTPKIVYGDEIGMGEDLTLEGRNSVRCPMQWTAGRNAGFSSSPKRGLVGKLIRRGDFSYKNINVENQRASPDSLWTFIRKLVALRRNAAVIGTSDFRPVPVDAPEVLAHSYENQQEQWFCVHNLSGKAVQCIVRLEGAPDRKLDDLLTGRAYPVKSGKLKLKMPAYGYLWLSCSYQMLS
ncbi:alpha-amylase family protein [Dyadobacter sp. 676]|uniref:Alpha-amylase family protein n=1 Tax=Dyadobacter sp. 676 TaxID=3088362 RepID=A0AAU8FQV5_9BACT